MKFVVKNENELKEVVRALLDHIRIYDDRATIVGLSGDLGAGKTTFVKTLARVLGVSQTVQSPTFVIEKQYTLSSAGGNHFNNLIHIDAYRIDTLSELEPLKFSETLSRAGDLVVIEWPERIQEALPADTCMVRFTFVDETTRLIEWSDA
jgi:tRNA threonylcarbamoyladenosine biosynthesis protein TsaE